MRKIFCFFLLFSFSLSLYAWDKQTRVAIYYGTQFPEELRAFNVVVVHPNIDISPKNYHQPNSQLYAYISVGELDPSIPEKLTDPRWRKGKNPAWNSIVMDTANPEWGSFLLDKVVAPLWEKGYRGFFLDTLDSYELLKPSPQERKQYQAGMIALIKKIKKRWPEAQLITNRGFEIMGEIHQQVAAVAAESLFAGWDTQKKRYRPVSVKDRTWLLAQLNKVHTDYQLPIISIDYLPPERRTEAQEVAKKIMQLGFIPWVSDPQMQTLGVGRVEVVPRKILVLLDDKTQIYDTISRLNFPLEYMGYIPELHVVSEGFLQPVSVDRYAGIIVWFDKPIIKQHTAFEAWLMKQMPQKVPIVFMQQLGFPLESSTLKWLNLVKAPDPDRPGEIKVIHQDKSIGYEIMPKPDPLAFSTLSSQTGDVLLRTKAESGEQEDVIAITPWGGYALDPFYMTALPNGQSKWILNPFDFFRRALRLPNIPVPDVTTENGRRILTIHVDGDAFASRIPWKEDKYASELMFEEIFSPNALPIAVSVIQCELEALKPNQALYERMMKTGRKIFALPWVNIATHTYSHPFLWGKVVEGKPDKKFASCPSPHYLFSYEKEVVGSTDFINRYLAPKDKKVTTIFWSGDARVTEKPLEIAYRAGLKNINGFATIYTRQQKSVTNLSPYGRQVGKYLQIFASNPNEFQYTQQWSPPYYAFEQAIHSFEMTDKPERYKPISIYYHFYSVINQAAFQALKQVYQWAKTQYITPLQINDYIGRVEGFYSTVIAKAVDPSDGLNWLLVNNGELREIRWLQSSGYPDLNKSRNVLGFNAHNHYYYLHLGIQAETWIDLTTLPPVQAYLIDANAKIAQWEKLPAKKSIQFAFHGYVPLSFKLGQMGTCKLMQNNQWILPAADQTYTFKGKNDGKFEIQCP